MFQSKHALFLIAVLIAGGAFGCCTRQSPDRGRAALVGDAMPPPPSLKSMRTRHPVIFTLEHPANSPSHTFDALIAPNELVDIEPGEFAEVKTNTIEDGEIIIEAGSFGYAVGTRPRLRTRRLGTHSDSTILLVEARDDVHRVYLLSKGPAYVTAGDTKVPLTDQFTFVTATWDADGVVQLSDPASFLDDVDLRHYVRKVLDLVALEGLPIVSLNSQ